MSQPLLQPWRYPTRTPPTPKAKDDIKNSRVILFAVMVSLTNPKVVLINLILLPLFSVADRSILLQGTVITITGTLRSFTIYAAYALLAAKFIAKLKTRTANRIVAIAYTFAAGALSTIQK